jgi:hypothetical protein
MIPTNKPCLFIATAVKVCVEWLKRAFHFRVLNEVIIIVHSTGFLLSGDLPVFSVVIKTEVTAFPLAIH